MKIDGDRVFMWAMGTLVVLLFVAGLSAVAGLSVAMWRIALQ